MSASQYRPRHPSITPRQEPFEYFGCACFESSRELASGVQVVEDVSLEEFELIVALRSLPRLSAHA